jgi:tRNA-modifying protein YgfZ
MFYHIHSSSLQKSSAILRIRGPDAYTYLQGQFTQDLKGPAGSISYGLWLNQKGKVIADSHVLRLDDNDFCVISLRSPMRAVRERLEAYLVADEVEIENEPEELACLAIWGEGVGEAVAKLTGSRPLAGRRSEKDGVRVFAGRWSAAENYELLVPAARHRDFCDSLRAMGLEETDATTAERERVLGGWPAVPADIGLNDLPNEGGLDETAISYTKGCFLGQEVMARLKNLGQVRRRLHVVQGPGEPPASGTALHQSGRRVGELRSSARDGGGFVAMAMLSLLHLNVTENLGVNPESPAPIRILRRV